VSTTCPSEDGVNLVCYKPLRDHCVQYCPGAKIVTEKERSLQEVVVGWRIVVSKGVARAAKLSLALTPHGPASQTSMHCGFAS